MSVDILAQLSTPTSSASSQKKNRCGCCNKRLGLVMFTCKCGGNYCGEHRMNEAHDCTFNYRELYKQTLVTQLPKVVANKVDKI